MLFSVLIYLVRKTTEKTKRKSESSLKNGKTSSNNKKFVGQQNSNGKTNRKSKNSVNNTRYRSQVDRCQMSNFNNFQQIPRSFNQRYHANYPSQLFLGYKSQITCRQINQNFYTGYRNHQNVRNCFRDNFRTFNKENVHSNIICKNEFGRKNSGNNSFRRHDSDIKVFDRYYLRNDFARNEFGSNNLNRNDVRRSAMRRVITRRCATRRDIWFCRSNGSKLSGGNVYREFYRTSENSRSYNNRCQENFPVFRSDNCFQYEQFSNRGQVEWSRKSLRYNCNHIKRYHPY